MFLRLIRNELCENPEASVSLYDPEKVIADTLRIEKCRDGIRHYKVIFLQK